MVHKIPIPPSNSEVFSIVQPELPQGNDIQMACLYAVFHDIAILHSLQLLLF